MVLPSVSFLCLRLCQRSRTLEELPESNGRPRTGPMIKVGRDAGGLGFEMAVKRSRGTLALAMRPSRWRPNPWGTPKWKKST